MALDSTRFPAQSNTDIADRFVIALSPSRAVVHHCTRAGAAITLSRELIASSDACCGESAMAAIAVSGIRQDLHASPRFPPPWSAHCNQTMVRGVEVELASDRYLGRGRGRYLVPSIHKSVRR